MLSKYQFSGKDTFFIIILWSSLESSFFLGKWALESGEKLGGGVGYGRDHIFQEQRRARLPLPPNPPISLPHFILPYKLTHSSSHPLVGQPNGPSEMRMKCRGLMGTPRVGEIYLPIPHPSDMCSGEKINNPLKSRCRSNPTSSKCTSGSDLTTTVKMQQRRAVWLLNLLVNLCFAFGWTLHRSPQRPFHPAAADLRKKSCKIIDFYKSRATYRVDVTINQWVKIKIKTWSKSLQ